MKKQMGFFLILALIVAGGAFAQRVGDTIQAAGQSWTVQELGGGRMVLQLVPSLNGVWLSARGNVMTLNGSTGVHTTQSPTHALWQDAINKGYLKVGDQIYRNISSSGNLRWTGQAFTVTYNTNAPNVAIGTTWSNATLTMSADGQTLQMRTSSGSTSSYTRRQ